MAERLQSELEEAIMDALSNEQRYGWLLITVILKVPTVNYHNNYEENYLLHIITTA